MVKLILVSPDITCASGEDIAKTLEIKGQNIFFVSSSAIQKQILDQFSCLHQVEVSKKLPQTLIISVHKRKAVSVVDVVTFDPRVDLSFRIESSQSAKESSASALVQKPFPSMLIDSSGFVFSRDFGEDSLPHLILISQEALTIGANNTLKQTLKIIAQLKELKFPYQQVEVAGDAIYLFNNQKPMKAGEVNTLIYPLNANDKVKTASLKIIIQKAKINNEGFLKLDLRFDRPIAVYVKL